MSVAKSPEFSILYNKKKLDADLSKKIQSVAFHFYLHGQANDIDIEIEDGDLEFAKDLKPKEGDTIKLNIGYSGENLFDCGEFEIDGGLFEAGGDGADDVGEASDRVGGGEEEERVVFGVEEAAGPFVADGHAEVAEGDDDAGNGEGEHGEEVERGAAAAGPAGGHRYRI